MKTQIDQLVSKPYGLTPRRRRAIWQCVVHPNESTLIFNGCFCGAVVDNRFLNWYSISTMVKSHKINEKKYKNTVLFFAIKIQNGTLGKLKLMKLLYYLDFDFFEKYGRSITGDEYLRFEYGPVPRMAEKILKAMNGREIKITNRKMPKGFNDQQHIEPLAEFNPKVFTKEEILMLEEIADKWEKFSGTEMKSASHGEAPWIATKQDDVIDYNLVYYRNKYAEMERL